MCIDLINSAKLFHDGELFSAYELLGAHKKTSAGKAGYIFRVWAPNAVAVHITGAFCDWDARYSMRKITEKGLWELFIPGLSEYDSYKYMIEDREGQILYKADPYGYHAELRPETASKIYDLEGYEWKDAAWLKKRAVANPYAAPMNIYEVHLGSWKRYEDGNFFSYSKLVEELIPYVKNMGYTHIELMPISEYPYDGSWGYQIIGYFAVTSRYGTPAEFMGFVDKCHQAGIGVIMDWVPGHFPKDAAGLYKFDGTACYEYSDEFKNKHEAWGTMVFDWARHEVKSFLISNAVFWFDKFHIDGLRVDAVASMLYLDYNRSSGNWRPNRHGGKENLEAIDFLKQLNKVVFGRFPYALMIAEESTSWPMVTKPTDIGGLGFNFKWNMGWMNDTLCYMGQDSLFRGGCHNKITFSMTYAFSENFILPLSHDEVVHVKGSLSNKMPGTLKEKLANLRTYFTYMMCHPGKKLIFMGGELAQFSEWNYEAELDWYLLDTKEHEKFHEFVKDLNHIYKNRQELWECDTDWDGFQWVNADDSDRNVFSFRRFDKAGNELMIICNFSPICYEEYLINLEDAAEYHLVFTSDAKDYGGLGAVCKCETRPGKANEGTSPCLALDIPGFSTSIWKRIRRCNNVD
ncbi:MAG: 1,4-alpha-glucan branching protein GlgB [Eubacteriales bacterium]|nr:1,4-alpha-glucan branching protein GlgB [Eubacteriales bacterium]MDD4389301.1 1,4-alpha-glucan branching protein GlgB [Eubacteriales bacterium]